MCLSPGSCFVCIPVSYSLYTPHTQFDFPYTPTERAEPPNLPRWTSTQNGLLLRTEVPQQVQEPNAAVGGYAVGSTARHTRHSLSPHHGH